MDNMIFALGDNDTDKQFDKTKLKILNEYLKFRNKNLLEINHDISLMLKNIRLTKFQYIKQRGKTFFHLYCLHNVCRILNQLRRDNRGDLWNFDEKFLHSHMI